MKTSIHRWKPIFFLSKLHCFLWKPPFIGENHNFSYENFILFKSKPPFTSESHYFSYESFHSYWFTFREQNAAEGLLTCSLERSHNQIRQPVCTKCTQQAFGSILISKSEPIWKPPFTGDSNSVCCSVSQDLPPTTAGIAAAAGYAGYADGGDVNGRPARGDHRCGGAQGGRRGEAKGVVGFKRHTSRVFWGDSYSTLMNMYVCICYIIIHIYIYNIYVYIYIYIYR